MNDRELKALHQLVTISTWPPEDHEWTDCYAVCKCGWVGTDQAKLVDASADHLLHVRQFTETKSRHQGRRV